MKVVVIVLVLAAIGIGAAGVNSPKQYVNSTTQNSGKQTREERAKAVFKGTGANRNLRDLAARATKDISVRVGPGLPVLSPYPTAFELRRFLEKYLLRC